MTYSLWWSLLCLQSCFICCLSLHHGDMLDSKVLNVGEELKGESLPLNMGRRLYLVQGLNKFKSYEVKISYPASAPARFTLHLMKDAPDIRLNKNRRLLDTEKIIFESDSHALNSDHRVMYVLVTVEAAAVVAKRNVQEREAAVFNIVCDELSLGIPHQAWWVGIAAVGCLIMASIIPYFLPSHLLPRHPFRQTVTKGS